MPLPRRMPLRALPPVIVALPAALSLLIPVATATMGTEELPELTDAEGDVDYDDLHVGPRESKHLDVLSAWFWHDPAGDRIHFTFKVASVENFLSPPRNYRYECTFRALAESPGGPGALFFGLHNSGGDPMRSVVAYSRESRSSYDAVSPRLQHELTMRQESHGYVDYAIDRQRVLNFAEELRDLKADCYEDYQPGPVTLYTNADASSSKGAYSVAELRRERGPDGQPDAIEQFSRTPPATSESATDGSGSTPAPSILLLTLAVTGAIVLRRASKQG